MKQRLAWMLVGALLLLPGTSQAGPQGVDSAAPVAAAPVPATSQTSSEALFREGLDQLQRGSHNAAIDSFELLADRGFVHPDASFNRAVAYVKRARSAAARPGDLGRAAAALAEVLSLRPGDATAHSALERVRAEIARARARAGADPVQENPSLARAVVSLISEDLLAVLALLGALLFSAGLLLRGLARAHNPRLSGAIVAAVGALLLLGSGALTAAARRLRTTTEPAVVVVPEARLLDARGAAMSVQEHGAIPEGALVHVRERRGRLMRVEWGSTEGWVSGGQLRTLARP